LVISIKNNNILDLEAMETSCKNALEKSKKFKQKPSRYGIREAKKNPCNEIHPFFLNNTCFSQEEVDKRDFMAQLKSFKPKTNIFEKIEVDKNEAELKKFKLQVFIIINFIKG
jgi:hypothetical protein